MVAHLLCPDTATASFSYFLFGPTSRFRRRIV